MWVSLVLLGLFVLAAVAGTTGRGVYDSRDPAYSLHLLVTAPAPPAQQPSPDQPVDAADPPS